MDEWKAHGRPKGRDYGFESAVGLNVGQREEEGRRRKAGKGQAGSWEGGGLVGRERRANLKKIPSGNLSFLYKLEGKAPLRP